MTFDTCEVCGGTVIDIDEDTFGCLDCKTSYMKPHKHYIKNLSDQLVSLARQVRSITDDQIFKIYLAGPLFSEGERDFLTKLKCTIEEKIPQADIIFPMDFSRDENPIFIQIYNRCIQSILNLDEEKDIIVAVLDGTQVDDGTAFEIGFAKQKGIRIFGLKTDFRLSGESGVCNLMIEYSCESISLSIDSLIEEILKL